MRFLLFIVHDIIKKWTRTQAGILYAMFKVNACII